MRNTKKMRDAIKTFEENKQTTLERLKVDIESNSLKADGTIEELFANAVKCLLTDDILNKSKKTI